MILLELLQLNKVCCFLSDNFSILIYEIQAQLHLLSLLIKHMHPKYFMLSQVNIYFFPQETMLRMSNIFSITGRKGVLQKAFK